MALTNTQHPEHLSINSPPDFSQHFEKDISAHPDAATGRDLREKTSFNESLFRHSGSSRVRQSTSITKDARASILTFAALARDKTQNAIASFAEPALRSRTSGTFQNDLYTNSVNQDDYTPPARRVSFIRPPVKDYCRQSISDSKQLPSPSHKDTEFNLSPSENKPRHSNMHQTSSRLLRMTDDERPFTRVSDESRLLSRYYYPDQVFTPLPGFQ